MINISNIVKYKMILPPIEEEKDKIKYRIIDKK